MPTSSIGKYISILGRQAQKYLSDLVKQYGIGYASYFFVMYIGANPNCSQREMCDAMSMDEAMATREMRKLLQSGYIIRERRPDDAKTYEISLSDTGKVLYRELKEKLIGWWGDLAKESNVDADKLAEQLKNMSEVAAKKLEELKTEGK
nr:MarR family transcriptional regulator [uncultured Sellimonas sp.]